MQRNSHVFLFHEQNARCEQMIDFDKARWLLLIKDLDESGCMKLYKHGLFQREVVRHMFQTSYWLPVGGVVGWCQRFNCSRRQENATPNLGIPVGFGYPVVLRGVPFQQAFSVVCMHFRPYFELHHNTCALIWFDQSQEICVWRGNEIWRCFQSGFEHNGLKLNFVEIHK